MARHLAQVYVSQKAPASTQSYARTQIRAALEREVVSAAEIETAIWALHGHVIWDVINSVENPNGPKQRRREPGAPAPPPLEPL